MCFVFFFLFHHKTDLSIILKIERLTNKSPARSSRGRRPLGTAAELSRGDPAAEHPCSVRVVLGHTTRMGALGQQPAGAALRTETLMQGLGGVKRKLNVQQPQSSAGRSPASPLVVQRGSVGASEMALGKKSHPTAPTATLPACPLAAAEPPMCCPQPGSSFSDPLSDFLPVLKMKNNNQSSSISDSWCLPSAKELRSARVFFSPP